MKNFWNHLMSPSIFYAKRPWYRPTALARRLINYYILVFVGLFLMQNSLLFPRWMSGAVLSTPEATRRAALFGLVPWDHPAAGVASPQGYVSRDFADPAPRGIVVVLHGNGGCAFDRSFYRDAFSQRGFRTFLHEYPGYGGRPGSPCAATIIGDARNLIRSLDRMGFGPVYVWGESIGSGVAAAVCLDPTLPVHGLTLMMPWNTLSHEAAIHYPIMPVGFILRDKYDSIANLQGFAHPICVICGTEDRIIPMPLSLDLFAHLTGPKKLMIKDGYGHGDWPCMPELAWWDEALDFIAPPSHSSKP